MSDIPEKVFENFPYLFDYLRTTVINKMQPDDRCRFSATSTWCSKEAKCSKNYIYALKFNDFHQSFIQIEVLFEEEIYTRKMHGFKLNFCNYPGRKRIDYLSYGIFCVPLWKIDLADSSNVLKLALNHFKKLLQFYQKSIKKLVIGCDGTIDDDFCDLQNFDFGIEKLRNLEKLQINTYADIRQFLPKTQLPLKELIAFREENNRGLECFSQIYRVQDNLETPYLQLNSEEFWQLSAANFNIHIGGLSEQDVARFIKSWQNGKLGKKNKSSISEWILFGSNFDLQKLVRLLGSSYLAFGTFGSKPLKVKHYKDEERKAKLWYHLDEFQLSFEADFRDDDSDED